MTEPITDAELDEWEHAHASVEKALDNDEPWDEVYFQKIDALEAVVERAFPRLLSEHRKMRAYIVETIGEDGLKDVLG